jgi:tRNA threonylcarbamoyladenosine biosynthesis protein TsaE
LRAVVTESAEATEELGRRLALLLAPGDFVALVGDLGAGKTRFVRGVVRGAGVDPAIAVTSPTFTLLNIYSGRIPIYHFDLYRLSGDDDVAALGFDEYFAGNGAALVEWAERLDEELPVERLEIVFSYLDDDRRRLEFHPRGERFAVLVETLFRQLGDLGNLEI